MGDSLGQWGTSEPKPGRSLGGPFWYYCGYDLQGLPEDGNCPECGSGFKATTVLTQVPYSAGQLCLMFGWPVVILLVISPGVVSEGGICLAIALLPVIMINGVIQYGRWRRKSTPPGLLSTPGQVRAVKWRRLALSLLLICVLGPPLVFGGCLVMLGIALRNMH